MRYVGFDAHRSKTQICVRDVHGEIISESSVRTRAGDLVEAVKPHVPCRVLVEASTEARWIVRALSRIEGVEALVVNPNYRATYASRGDKKKTDLEDARALAEAARTGVYKVVQVPGEEHVRMTQQHRVRAGLVATRTRLVSTARALVRSEGLRVKSCATENFPQHLREVEGLPEELAATLALLGETIEMLNAKIAVFDERVAKAARTDESARLLQTIPGVGPVLATAFAAAIGDPRRFEKTRDVGSYFGAAPNVSGSGERGNRNGRMTKKGPSYIRGLLAQSSQCILHSATAEAQGLRDWALGIAQKHGTVKRGGRRRNAGHNIAVGALSRKLSVIMTAMLKTRTAWDPKRQKTRAGRTYRLKAA